MLFQFGPKDYRKFIFKQKLSAIFRNILYVLSFTQVDWTEARVVKVGMAAREVISG